MGGSSFKVTRHFSVKDAVLVVDVHLYYLGIPLGTIHLHGTGTGTGTFGREGDRDRDGARGEKGGGSRDIKADMNKYISGDGEWMK